MFFKYYIPGLAAYFDNSAVYFKLSDNPETIRSTENCDHWIFGWGEIGQVFISRSDNIKVSRNAKFHFANSIKQHCQFAQCDQVFP